VRSAAAPERRPRPRARLPWAPSTLNGRAPRGGALLIACAAADLKAPLSCFFLGQEKKSKRKKPAVEGHYRRLRSEAAQANSSAPPRGAPPPDIAGPKGDGRAAAAAAQMRRLGAREFKYLRLTFSAASTTDFCSFVLGQNQSNWVTS